MAGHQIAYLLKDHPDILSCVGDSCSTFAWAPSCVFESAPPPSQEPFRIIHTMWGPRGPLVISWFITPSSYSYNYHQPNLLLFQANLATLGAPHCMTMFDPQQWSMPMRTSFFHATLQHFPFPLIPEVVRHLKCRRVPYVNSHILLWDPIWTLVIYNIEATIMSLSNMFMNMFMIWGSNTKWWFPHTSTNSH